jgi:hypothetical protein
MSRTVIIPNAVDSKLNTLAQLVEEVNGVLLFRRVQDYCPIETLFVTGVGSEGHVESRPDRAKVVNEFFQRNPEYRFVKFHTHSQGTVRKYGSHYAQNFSKEDLAIFAAQLKEDPEYMHLLATPSTKLLYGADNPTLQFVSDFSGRSKRGEAVDKSLEGIAKRLGVSLDSLQARRT